MASLVCKVTVMDVLGLALLYALYAWCLQFLVNKQSWSSLAVGGAGASVTPETYAWRLLLLGVGLLGSVCIHHLCVLGFRVCALSTISPQLVC